MPRSPLRLAGAGYDLCLLLACAAYCCLTVRYFIDTDVSFPVFDNWSFFADVATFADRKDLSSFVLRQTNEHRPVILFTSMVLDYLACGLSLAFMKSFHLVSYGALVALVVWLCGRAAGVFEPSLRTSARLLCCAAGLFLILNMRQWEVHYGYTNLGTIQGFLFFAGAMHLCNRRLDRRACGERVTEWSLAGVVLLASLASASMAFGLMTIPFVLAVSLLRGAPRKESLFLALATCLFFLVYRTGMDVSPAHGAEWRLGAADAARVLYFAALLLGSLFIANKKIALVLGVAGGLVAASLTAVLAGKKERDGRLVTVLALMLLCVAYAVMVGIGRRHMVDEQAMVSRYMLTAAIFWQSAGVLSLCAALRLFPRQGEKLLLAFRVLLVPVVVVLFVQQKVKHDYVAGMARTNAIGVNALQYDIYDRDTFPWYQIIDLNDFLPWVRTLQAHRTSIYGSAPARCYGERLGDQRPVRNELLVGRVERMEHPPTFRALVDDSCTQGLKLSGWVRSTRPGASPSAIILVDQDRVIRGGGRCYGQGSGWVAFARLAPKDTKIDVYALYGRENTLCRICSAQIPAPHPALHEAAHHSQEAR